MSTAAPDRHRRIGKADTARGVIAEPQREALSKPSMEGASSVSLDFKTVAYPYPDGGRTEFGIQMARIDTPSIEAISDITIPLSHFAKECGGDYDGWETSIMCDDPGENGDN